MNWIVHPARLNTTKTVVSALFILLFLAYIAIFWGVFWAIFGFIVLFVSLHSYYFPTQYEVGGDYVQVKNIFFTQRRSLKEFVTVYEGRNGILLSPFKRKTVLNQFRGIFLLLPPERDDILHYVKQRIAALQENEKEKDEGSTSGPNTKAE
jgi:hypothetical protein